MRVGKMRDSIAIKKITQTVDGTGADINTVTTLDTVRAEAMTVRGAEREVAGRLAATQNILIRIRYRSDVSTSNFVVLNGKEMPIVSVSDRWQKYKVRKGMYLWLDCEDGAEI